MDVARLSADQLATLVADQRLLDLHAYWQAKRGDRPWALRADIRPEEIPRLLPYLFLLEATESPRRFRFRLVGTAITAFAGRDVTGRFIDRDLYGDAMDSMVWIMGRVLDEARPHLTLSNTYWMEGRSWRRAATLMLPLSTDGGTASMVLGGIATEPLAAEPDDPSLVRRYMFD